MNGPVRAHFPRTYLARIRYDAGFPTATAAAEKLNKHQSTIAAIERGAKLPTDELLLQMSKLYRRSIADLLSAWNRDRALYERQEAERKATLLKRGGVKHDRTVLDHALMVV